MDNAQPTPPIKLRRPIYGDSFTKILISDTPRKKRAKMRKAQKRARKITRKVKR